VGGMLYNGEAGVEVRNIVLPFVEFLMFPRSLSDLENEGHLEVRIHRKVSVWRRISVCGALHLPKSDRLLA
jgi:hypothetical protein